MLEPIEFEKMVRTRAHRILNKLPLYKSCVDNDCDSSNNVGIIPIDQNNQLIGIYENSISNSQDNVFITDKDIYFYRGSWQFIEYSQIQEVRIPLSSSNNKKLARMLAIQTRLGESIGLEFISGTVDYADVWEVYRFFSRVIADYGKRF